MTARARKPSGRYRIGAVEALTGVTRDAIHHYLDLGLLPPPEKSAQTVTWFDDGHVARLHQIRALRNGGVSLARVKSLLDAMPGAAPDTLAAVGQMLGPDELPATPDAAHALLAPGIDALAAPLARAWVAAWCDGDDPVTSTRAARESLDVALRAAWAQRVTSSLVATAAQLGAHLAAAARASFVTVDAAHLSGGTLRLAALDAMPGGDPAVHVERLRLAFGILPVRRIGPYVEAARAARVDDAWVDLAGALVSFESGRHDVAARGFDAALSRRAGWPLAAAFAWSARTLALARVGSGVFETLRALRDLDAMAPDAGDALPVRVRTGLVLAQTLAALPAVLDRDALALRRCDDALAELAAVPADDLRRGTGELARVEANLWLVRAALCQRAGDATGARDARTHAAAFGGGAARAAKSKHARLT